MRIDDREYEGAETIESTKGRRKERNRKKDITEMVEMKGMIEGGRGKGRAAQIDKRVERPENVINYRPVD